jgi:prophage regulatory protein
MKREPPTGLGPGAQLIQNNALHGQELPRMLISMTGHLVGLSEIASMLGVTRQRASQLVRDYDDFPPPVAQLASGRVWETAAVEAWAKAHPERPPGRRVKEPGHGS